MTLCRWSAKQKIPLSVLVQNQTKGFGLEISTRSEVGKVTPIGVGRRNSEKSVGDGRRRVADAVDTGHLRDQSDEIGSNRGEGRPVKMSQHSSWVVEF